MLKSAYFETTDEKLNKLISEGNYKYLDFANYNYFEPIELENSEWDIIQKVSVDDLGNILGYFSANVNRSQNRIDSCYFVKFRYKYEEYTHSENRYSFEVNILEKIVDEDFKQFLDEILNHPIIDYVRFSAIYDNPANKTYLKLMEKYNGVKYIFPKEIMLSDGKYYDKIEYVFSRRK